MPSFDVISKISYPEFDNALANCLREIGNRFDFKGLDISIERKDKIITTLAPDASGANVVIILSFLSIEISSPLKSNRLPISLRQLARALSNSG